MVILLVAAGILGIAVWISKVSPPQPAVPLAVPVAAGSTSVSDQPVTRQIPMTPVMPANVPGSTPTNALVLSKVEHEEWVSKRSAELNALAMEPGPEAHQQIVDELKNSDKAIRHAALEALEQANDRSVVPQMQQIAEQTDDPGEKQAILDAIDFINLPSLTEYLHQSKGKGTPGNQP